jgi:hypothetical protein
MHDLDRLVEQVYDAAVEPGRWPHVLEMLSDFLEGAATKLTFQNVRTLHSEANSVRMPPEADRSYAQYYYKTNVFLQRIAKLRAGTLIPVWNLLPREVYLRSEFYNDFCEPNDMCHPIGWCWPTSPTCASCLPAEAQRPLASSSRSTSTGCDISDRIWFVQRA